MIESLFKSKTKLKRQSIPTCCSTDLSTFLFVVDIAAQLGFELSILIRFCEDSNASENINICYVHSFTDKMQFCLEYAFKE